LIQFLPPKRNAKIKFISQFRNTEIIINKTFNEKQRSEVPERHWEREIANKKADYFDLWSL